MATINALLIIIVGIMSVIGGGQTNPEQENRRESLLEKLQLLRSLDLGFGAVRFDETVNSLSDDQLLQYVRAVDNEVPCKYLYRALEYTRLIEPALNPVPSVQIIAWTISLSNYFKPFLTSMMYHVVDNIRSIASLMWIFHEYAETVRQHLATVDDRVGRENRPKVLALHGVMKKMLVEHLTSEQCIGYYYQTNAEQLMSLSAQQPYDSHGVWLNAITDTINKICEKTNSLPKTDGYKHPCLKRMLCLNNTLPAESTGLVDTLKEFLAEKHYNIIADGVRNLFTFQNDKNLDFGTKIRTSGQILYDFVVILKAIVLRKVIYYLKKVQNMMLTDGWQYEFLVKHNADMSRHLSVFLDFLFMRHDEDIVIFIDLFNKTVEGFTVNMKQKQKFFSALYYKVILKFYQNNILLKPLNIGENSAGNFLQDLYEEKFKTVEDTSSSTERFVNSITKKFANISFKIIHSFVQVRGSKELDRFDQLTKENNSQN